MLAWLAPALSAAARLTPSKPHEQQITLAFKDGTNAAAIWANLMRSNDANLMLATCTELAINTLEGRKACNVPLRLDPPSLAAPNANSRASHPSWQIAAASVGATTGEQSDDRQRGRGVWGFRIYWERSF